MQFPMGILADRYANNRMFAIVGIALVLAGVLPFPVILSVLLGALETLRIISAEGGMLCFGPAD